MKLKDTKQCSVCNKVLSVEKFHKHHRRGFRDRCKQCSSAYQKQWYAKNRQHAIANTYKLKKARIKQNRLNVLEYLESHFCIDCKEADVLVLEFDHRNSKLKYMSISKMIQQGYLWNTVLKEIRKCVVRCANCHRRRTAKQFGSYRLSGP